ncbi:hypothetical protein F8M41_003349 [Gigaspora margarita]|uniref:F-box domain-containing protein n=1 Tax=Gigaspora margarita TaxID=4874 RepID=A0A8H3XBD9_GIGMA|nr:hypothetical protein F8M41_003349 [Gigaspora margarita]
MRRSDRFLSGNYIPSFMRIRRPNNGNKIFMGNMPELMELILNNIAKDFHYSLFSCALVSRHCGASLRELDVYFPESNKIKPGIFQSLERNELFFSRLQYLSLSAISEFSTENAVDLLKILAKNTTRIIALKLDESYSQYDSQLIHELINIIKSQEQLRQFTLAGILPDEFHGIISALECQKQSLREVIIETCGYSDEFKILMNCENLEILRMRFCDYENIMELLDNKINTLEILDYEIDASELALFFKKSGKLLQRLKLESLDAIIFDQSLLLDALKSFCPNITYLDVSIIEFSTQFLVLIGNLRKLQFLTLSVDTLSVDEIPDEERVIRFAKILPLTLQYLDLRYSCLISFIEILLKYCYAPLKKLLIDDLDEDKLKALIKFSNKRNRSLSYVGVSNYSDLGLDDIGRTEEYVRLSYSATVQEYLEVEDLFTLVPCEDIIVHC